MAAVHLSAFKFLPDKEPCAKCAINVRVTVPDSAPQRGAQRGRYIREIGTPRATRSIHRYLSLAHRLFANESESLAIFLLKKMKAQVRKSNAM